ncbi:hypothetical protein NEOLEDRAFT_1168302 [Neolentinus lepideus HHB14362 ss-1]|uniref:HNH nuclease domain-containing protein n=1 Tax=Neolentinus lepideus HHB14362 ss-1 TaxID=1314782 RepID=A0A165TT61_9AGAM|nr:hypothetical protein NEOLEDRAFT_1168302 [Neolentinus lepideus HHB14362 ss-1]
MSHRRSRSDASVAGSISLICGIISCSTDEYFQVYEAADPFTDELCSDARMHIIQRHRERLRAANRKVDLAKLLDAMIEHAPNENERRHVAVVLHIAEHAVKTDAITENAVPVLAISLKRITQPSSGPTPHFDGTAPKIEKTNLSEQGKLRDSVRRRENYRCPVTGHMDASCAENLGATGQKVPVALAYLRLQATHIIFLSFNNFDDDNSSRNSLIYFQAYPDAPHKYSVRAITPGVILNAARKDVDVTFRSVAELGVEPPDPELLRIPAAFAKVLHACGAAEYYERLEREGETGALMQPSDHA